MEVFEAIADVREARWAEPSSTWGLVPTMGFLHDGHLNLVRRAAADNDHVGVSIFVNPAQFNDASDLTRYPRNLARDLNLLEAAGVDVVWTPTPDLVYPDGYQTYVDVELVTRPLEGEHRMGHFRGVATVVSKLFNVFQPTHAYFGQKDAQQALTVTRMVEDLNFNLAVVVCETSREPDGLAMSSRNANLSADARAQSPRLYEALQAARQAYASGERNAAVLRRLMTKMIAEAPLAAIDYISVADPRTLEEFEQVDSGALVLLAVQFGDVRLIDNILL